MLKSSFKCISTTISLLMASGAATSSMAGELVYWSMWNEAEPQAQALKEIMDSYTAANPETTFKVVWNGRQNQTKLRQAMSANTPVDLMDQDSDQLAGGLQFNDQLLDVSSELAGDVKSALLPGVLDLFARDGKIEQIPYIYNTVNFWYDKAALEAYGAVPNTWDELLALCTKAREADTHLLVIEANVAFYNLPYFSHYLSRKLGSDALTRSFADKSGAAWRDPAVLEAAKASLQLWEKDCIAKDARGFQYPAGQQTIALGQTTGELVGSWLPTELSATVGDDFKWGAFNFPAVEGGAGKATDIEVATISMAVLKDAPNKSEAIAFTQYLLGAEPQALLAEKGGVGVTRAGVAWPAELADAEKSASTATSLVPYGGGLKILYPEFESQVLQQNFNKMFLGEITAEAFVDTLAAQTKAYWDANP